MEGLLKDFIQTAYEVEPYQVEGGREANVREIREMLQTLLADRFQLKLHHESRVMAGYVLSVDKNAP